MILPTRSYGLGPTDVARTRRAITTVNEELLHSCSPKRAHQRRSKLASPRAHRRSYLLSVIIPQSSYLFDRQSLVLRRRRPHRWACSSRAARPGQPPPRNSKCCAPYRQQTRGSTPISPPDFLAIVGAVSNSAQRYTLLGSNCDWFVAMHITPLTLRPLGDRLEIAIRSARGNLQQQLEMEMEVEALERRRIRAQATVGYTFLAII
ncbi:hypothetical protein C8R45DRAFT_1041773 [Mycena sanguinolenta]|nr:hypothetical protein C8R45DRAFT_1041773 [Mycena sanguinolenta]